MNASCLLVQALATSGPSAVPWQPCCTAAVVALHDRDQPDGIWLCPIEERDNDLALPPPGTTP